MCLNHITFYISVSYQPSVRPTGKIGFCCVSKLALVIHPIHNNPVKCTHLLFVC